MSTLTAPERTGLTAPDLPRAPAPEGIWQRPRVGETGRDFDQVATVSFQGTVVAFARVETPTSNHAGAEPRLKTDIYYNVLALDVDSASDELDWDGWRRLDVPNEVRPSGMQLINVPVEYNRSTRLAGLEDAGAPFRVVSNQEYIYLLRQAAGGTLLVNRLRLVRQVSQENPKAVEYVLQPAWEVRFQKSGKPDVPRDDRDVQSYQSPDKEPFVEPTLEIPIPGITEGRFDAVLLPRTPDPLLMCTLAVRVEDRLDVYEIPLDQSGRFLLGGKAMDGDHLAADFSVSLQTEDQQALLLSERPELLFFLRQERVMAPHGAAGHNGKRDTDAEDDSFLLKRAGRVLLAVRAQISDAPATLATVELAVAADGTLARPANPLTLAPVGVAPYTLAFAYNSYVGLPDITLSERFAFDLWLFPTSTASPQRVVCNPDDPAAPHLSLVDGNRLELSFTDADGKVLTGRTTGPAVRHESWSRVQVEFDHNRDRGEQFAFWVNEDRLDHEESGEGTTPSDAPITALSAASDGYVGEVDSLAIYNAAGFKASDLAGDWPLDTVLYTDPNGEPLRPPETPNRKDGSQPGRVFGAQLVPSTSPAATGAGGALSFDAKGLSILAGYFEDLTSFGELQSSPALLASADGLIHCYFRGRDDRLSVMQRDVEAARAIFEVTWSTVAGAEETGPLQLVAAQSGSFMNHATVEIADPAGGPREAFCDMTLASTSGRTETWRGVPRSLVPFALTLNGEAVTDPSDPRLLTGATTYYDASGTRTAAYVPLPDNVEAALAGFVTRYGRGFPLASIEVNQVADEQLDLTITHDVPRWEGVTLVQTWRSVPARITELLQVLEGRSTRYEYKTGTGANIPSYSIGAEAGPDAANTVVFFTRPTVKKVRSIVVRNSTDPNLCDVDITLQAGPPLSATWTQVDRRQDLFSITVEGANQDYDYANLAEGDYQAIGEALVLTTDGNTARVGNVNRTAAQGNTLQPDDDLRVYASLFEAFVTAPVTVADKLPPTSVTALRFQGATAVVEGQEPVPIKEGSHLFRAHLAALPDQGSVARVGNTASFTDGTAVLVRQGMNGGWRNTPEQRTLTFEEGGYVEFATDEAQAPNIDALTIPGDMSVELWCRPTRSNRDSMDPNQRLLTFARTPAADVGGKHIRYLAGLTDCPSLRAGTDTSIVSDYRTDLGTLVTWFSPLAIGGDGGEGLVATLAPLDPVEPTITISVDADHRIQADFLLGPDAEPIVWEHQVANDEWYQVALPWSVTKTQVSEGYQYDFTAELYVNGASAGRREWQATDDSSLQWATMTVGDPSPQSPRTLAMLVNEVAFLARELGPADIGQFSQQRIPDNTPDLIWKWMLLEGEGHTAVNSAATEPDFSPVIQPSTTWEKFGLYMRPTMGHGDNVAVLNGEPIIPGWSHLALVHQAGYALDLRGDDYASCGNDPAAELGDEFSIEAWVEPAPATVPAQAMTVLAKGEDYELAVDADLRPQFSTRVKAGGNTETITLRGDRPLSPDAATYLAVTYELVPVEIEDGDKVEPRYEVHIALWVDGAVAARGITQDGQYKQFEDMVERIMSSADLNLGRSSLHGGCRYLRGYLSDTRLWTRVLSEAELAEAYLSRRAPANRDGLAAWWRFNEVGGGRIAFDQQGDSDARLSRGDLRVGYQPTSTNLFYVNGRSAMPTWLDGPSSVGGYPTGDAFQLAYCAGSDPVGFYGQLDAVRIWSTQLTGEQIADSRHRPSAGTEPFLAGAWNFDDGSGPVIEDATGRGNTGHRAGSPLPEWAVSTAPLANEAEGVMNILGGVPTFVQDLVTATPAVVEYADLQRDAYGDLISVMKRAYISVDDGAVHLVTGYKVGDLETVYLGQAQSQPSVIGFIEGAPPIPSENQTTPWWNASAFWLNNYGAASSVTFEEADRTTYVYNASRALEHASSWGMKGGLEVEAEVKLSFGIFSAVQTPAIELTSKLGQQGGYEISDTSKEDISRTTGTALTMPTALAPAGSWEPGAEPDDWVNPTVGRRYIPDNTGMALVKSRTVDVYASILASTRTTVKISYAPNHDIPEDVNILTFPIDPRYVKNGTLDGKVGLENDPDYGDADLEPGSYFKPVEAYALKRRIEREETRQASYYAQFDVARQASRLLPGWRDHREDQESNEAYDWAAHLAKRNIVNTYVWTAAGGTHAEQTSPMNVYSESYGAVSSRTGKHGMSASISFPQAGFFLEHDALYSYSTTVDVVRNRESAAAFSLNASVDPDAYLHAPRINGDDITFVPQPTEGKVDGYRYMSFYLAPSNDNFQDLFQTVIDRRWLAESMEASAVALREATAANNGAWRVLHRVTYVSRIPPRFQPVPDETRSPDVEPPANPEYNALLVALIDRTVGTKHPTPVEIGEAISTVIGTASAPGLLAGFLPWWPQFLKDTENYALPAAGILRTLREDLLRYMIETYAEREADRHG